MYSKLQYTVYNVLMYHVQCTMYLVYNVVFNVQYSVLVYSVQCTVYSVQYTAQYLYNVVYNVHCTVYNVQTQFLL